MSPNSNNTESIADITAASALANLAKDDTQEAPARGAKADEDFQIPQRYTKSGRKRAVPFAIKVRFLREEELHLMDTIFWQD